MMDQVLNMGDYFVVEWDFKNNMLRNKYGNMLSQRRHEARGVPEAHATGRGSAALHDLNTRLATGVISHFDMKLSFNRGTGG